MASNLLAKADASRVVALEAGTSTWNQAATDAADATNAAAILSRQFGGYVPYSGAVSNVDLAGKLLENVMGLYLVTNEYGNSLIQGSDAGETRIWARDGPSSGANMPYISLIGTNGGVNAQFVAVYSSSGFSFSTATGSWDTKRHELKATSNLVEVVHLLPAAADAYDLGASNKTWRSGYFGAGDLMKNGTNVLIEPPAGAVYARSNTTWIAIQNAIVTIGTNLNLAITTNGHVVTYAITRPTNEVFWTYATVGTQSVVRFIPADGTPRYIPY